MTGQKKLNAIVQVVVERDFRNRRVDSNLHLRPVDLLDCPLDNSIVRLTRVNKQTIVDNVGCYPHAREQRCAAGCAARQSAGSSAGYGRSCRVSSARTLCGWCDTELLSYARVCARLSTEARSELSVRRHLIAARRRNRTGTWRDLVERRVQAVTPAAVEHVIEHSCHLASFAITHAIDPHARIGIVSVVQALDPCCRGFQKL